MPIGHVFKFDHVQLTWQFNEINFLFTSRGDEDKMVLVDPIWRVGDLPFIEKVAPCPVSCRHSPGVGPAIRLGVDAVVVIDERQHLFPQVVRQAEVAPLEQAPRQYAEPDLHLVQPRRVLRHINESDSVRRIDEFLLDYFCRLFRSA